MATDAEQLSRAPPELKKALAIKTGLDAINALAEGLPAEALDRLVASASKRPYAFLVDLLTAAAPIAGSKASPLDRALARGLAARQEILGREGGLLSGSDLGKLFRPAISRQAVDQRRQKKQLFALEDGSGHFNYPSWQVQRGTALNGLQDVLEALDTQDPMAALLFFLEPDPRLNGQRPLDHARKGDADLVLKLARTYGEHGAL
jgi:hypothetical protein